ncbi:MAG: SPOR domain-containing protein [Flavobacterium micromati]|nr:SPOR domain-containing protein [Flavobacterium micromati]
MRFLAIYTTFLYTLTLCFSSLTTSAQNQNTTVKQDSKFEQLLNEKRKVSILSDVKDKYQIQIFSGDSERAKNTLTKFRQEYTLLDGTIVFFTPNYKVWVGNFTTRIEAERNLIEIRKTYSNVNLIRPSK